MALARYCITQVRTTVNFFARYREDQLWKTITSVSPAGMKKGRRGTRQPIRPLKHFYQIGQSPLKVIYPGLNEPLANHVNPISIREATDEERQKDLSYIHDKLVAKGNPKRYRREKLTPLERGFSGGYVMGQRLGPPPPDSGVNFDEFQSYCLDVKRTCRMTRIFGRVYTMEALVVTGNGKGLAGYELGKAPLFKTNVAIARALRLASKRLFYVNLLENRTIYQDFFAECRNLRLFAQRRPAGFGLLCHPRLQKICEAIGIKDIYVKVEGATHNYRALTHAFITGLMNQEEHQQLADRTRLHVVELSPNNQFLPKVVASPVKSAVKSTDEITDQERLKMDDFYGEGRIPLYKPKPKPFYVNTPGHLFAEWRKHPFRNMEDKMVRLLADDDVSRWTRTIRHKHAEDDHEAVMSGVKPMPRGIGLPDVLPRNARN